MNRKYTLALLAFCFAVPFMLQAQVQHTGICGTENFELIAEKLLQNKQLIRQGLIQHRDGVDYVPIKYHLVAENDGSGRIKLKKVLEQHTALNRDYSTSNLQFYIEDDFNYINNSTIYTSQSSLFARSEMEKARSSKAINIFFTKEARSSNNGNGVVLGYHSVFQDWLVIRNDQVNAQTGTLSHEVGHFFSLLHTHNGWDGFEWDHTDPSPIQVANTSPGNVPTERQDGSNCETAGDFICDTPPDYNFGFGWRKDNDTCAPYDAGVKDPSGMEVDPMENNFMGYFINCNEYSFTEGQIAVMAADFSSSSRNYIRSGHTPNTNAISERSTLIAPIANSETEGFNRVDFDWESVPQADRYLIEVDRLPDFSFDPISEIVFATSTSLYEFEAGKFYFWRITPLNEYTTNGTPSSTERFKAGAGTVSANYIEGVNNWFVSPNPTQNQQNVQLHLNSQTEFQADIRLYSTAGQLVGQIPQYQFLSGNSIVVLPTNRLPAGLYIVSLQTKEAIINRKLVIR